MNYRGISLSPILSKVVEKCVARHLMVFTENLIYYHQHSFPEDLSCTTQLLSVLHATGISLDRGLETDIIYLDLTRALDTVPRPPAAQTL